MAKQKMRKTSKQQKRNVRKTKKIYKHKDHYHTRISDKKYKKAKCAPNPERLIDGSA